MSWLRPTVYGQIRPAVGPLIGVRRLKTWHLSQLSRFAYSVALSGLQPLRSERWYFTCCHRAVTIAHLVGYADHSLGLEARLSPRKRSAIVLVDSDNQKALGTSDLWIAIVWSHDRGKNRGHTWCISHIPPLLSNSWRPDRNAERCLLQFWARWKSMEVCTVSRTNLIGYSTK